MMRTVKVNPHETTADVVWTGGDGKPRCAHHPDTCLVRANSVGDPTTLYGARDYVCARCLRDAHRG